MRITWGIMLSIAILTSGCIGPGAIEHERIPYSEAIAITGREQFLLNLVRLHNHELPQFVDISQVVNTSTLTGSIGASINIPRASNAQAYNPVFSIGGTDQPAITYTPLLGSALVNQIAQPITVDTIAALIDSDWQVEPLLAFTVDRMSISRIENTILIDDIADLRDNRLLTFAAIKSPYTSGTLDDSLMLYFENSELGHIFWEEQGGDTRHQRYVDEWEHLKSVFDGTVINPRTVGINIPAHINEGPAPNPADYSIELRTSPTTQPVVSPPMQVIPLLRFRSALGVLINAEDNQSVLFLDDIPTEPEYSKWPDESDPQNPYVSEFVPISREKGEYLLAANYRSYDLDESSFTNDVSSEGTYYGAALSKGYSTQYVPGELVVDKNGATHELKELRHYLAVFRSSKAPPDGMTYVCVTYNSQYYYIKKSDVRSQGNFELLQQLILMQSQASASPPPAPTINVGGH